jgi:RNA polymerase sigma-70 factor (ECF subfamily)
MSVATMALEGSPEVSRRTSHHAEVKTAVTQKDDRELIAQCKQGNQAAYRELVERYRERAYWIAHGMLNNHDDARDASQEAFIRVFRSIDRFNLKYKFYTWLYQIVVNLCIDRLRKGSSARKVSLEDLGELKDDGEGPLRKLERNELKRRVEAILDTLPLKYKTTIVLRDIEGFSSKEISEIVGSTHATVRWRLHRARKLFKENWEKRYKEAPHEM